MWFQYDFAPLHYTVVKCVNGCLKIILHVGQVADVKLEFLGLHAHLT
jgi:hypothetical protein